MIRKTKLQISIVLLMSLVLSVSASIMVDRFLQSYLSRCEECQKSGVREGHRQMCPAGHIYYECAPKHVQQHFSCTRHSPPSSP